MRNIDFKNKFYFLLGYVVTVCIVLGVFLMIDLNITINTLITSSISYFSFCITTVLILRNTALGQKSKVKRVHNISSKILFFVFIILFPFYLLVFIKSTITEQNTLNSVFAVLSLGMLVLSFSIDSYKSKEYSIFNIK